MSVDFATNSIRIGAISDAFPCFTAIILPERGGGMS